MTIFAVTQKLVVLMQWSENDRLLIFQLPLARTAMYSKGVNNYLAPTTDARDSWQMTLRHIACEGRWGCNQFVTKSIYPPDLDGIEDLDN
jgi:nitrilase